MRRYLAGLLLVALAACGGDKTTSPDAAISGSYMLQSLNGASVPAVLVEDEEERDELTAGVIVLRSDRTWNITLSLRVTDLTDNSVFTIPLTSGGTYTNSGSSVTLVAPGGLAPLNGTVSGGKLTIAGEVLGTPSTLVFSK